MIDLGSIAEISRAEVRSHVACPDLVDLTGRKRNPGVAREAYVSQKATAPFGAAVGCELHRLPLAFP